MIHSLNGSMLFLYSFECQIIRNGCKRVSSVNALYFMVPPHNKISIYRQLGLMYFWVRGWKHMACGPKIIIFLDELDDPNVRIILECRI